MLPAEIAASGAATVVPEDGKPYQLRMTNLHTGESLDIVYRIGNTYLPEALEKLNYFLRDHNTQDVSNYDPKEFDVLHAMMARLGKLNSVIEVVCGYRTPETNAALRQHSPQTGVAEHSQHMEGHAIDLRVPGVTTAKLRDAALSLQAGGVGYYPVSQFVHVDVGPVREWVFGSKQRRTIIAQTRRAHSSHSSGGIAGSSSFCKVSYPPPRQKVCKVFEKNDLSLDFSGLRVWMQEAAPRWVSLWPAFWVAGMSSAAVLCDG